MWIIDPSYQSASTCNNVIQHTKYVILDELLRAKMILNNSANQLENTKEEEEQTVVVKNSYNSWAANQTCKVTTDTLDELFESLEANHYFDQYLQIDVQTREISHAEFYGYFESKLIKLIKISEKKNKYNEFDPNKLSHLICLRPSLQKYKSRNPNFDEVTTLYFGIYVRDTPESQGKQKPSFEQIKKMMQRVINAFVKEMKDFHLDKYAAVFGTKVGFRIEWVVTKRESIETAKQVKTKVKKKNTKNKQNKKKRHSAGPLPVSTELKRFKG